jgi:uncharacterized protein with beta-barrel porin domain
MTKKKFLSKRLACLLTTALITTSLSNLAKADDVGAALEWDSETGAAVFDTQGGVLTISVPGNKVTNAVTGITFGTGITLGTVLVTDVTGDVDVLISGNSTASTFTVRTADNVTGDATTLTFGDAVTDLLTVTGNLLLDNLDTGAGTLSMVVVGDIAVTGTTTLNSVGAGSAAATTLLTLQDTATFTGAVTLNDGVTGGGTSKILVNTDTVNTITFTGGLLSAAAGEGQLQINAGAVNIKTIAGSIGTSSVRFGTVTIDTPTTLSANTIATTLDINDNTTVSGTVDATGIDIAAAKTATFTNNVTAGANKLSVIGTATFSGTSAQSVTGQITGAAATGAIIVSNPAGVTFNNEVGGTVASNKEIQTLTTSGTGRVTMALDNNIVNEVALGTGTTLEVAKTVLTTQALFNTSTEQDLNSIHASSIILMPVNLKDGQFIDLFDGGTVSDALNTDVNSALRDNALIDYTAATADTNHTRVTATAKSAATTSSELGISNNMAIALKEAYLSSIDDTNIDGAAEDAMYNALQAQGGYSDSEDTAFAKQVSPQTDMIIGSTIAAKAVTSGVQNVISTRLASLRSGDAYSTGIVTGSHMGANSGFIQAFGSTVEQKNKGNEFGYDADTAGIALGFDTKVPGGAVIGISYARSEADVDGKGTGRAKNDITTDSVSLYADYATKDGYVEGSITYGKSDNKGSRIVNTAGLNRTYNSNYDGEQYSFRLSGGIPQSLGGGAFFTPFAAATISQIKADAYTETSTTTDDALRLRVAQDTVDSQVGTIGVKFHQAIKDGKTTFTPEVKLAVNQEFGDDTITSTNTYQGGGASFKNSTAIEKTSATAGVGLNISSDNVSFNIGYEADVRDKYLGHSAQAKITAKF